MVAEDRIAGQLPLMIEARLHALRLHMEAVVTVVRRLLMEEAQLGARCRLTAVAVHLRAQCHLMEAAQVEAELRHPAVLALVEGDPPAEVEAADTSRLPAQAVVASMEAAADANFQL